MNDSASLILETDPALFVREGRDLSKNRAALSATFTRVASPTVGGSYAMNRAGGAILSAFSLAGVVGSGRSWGFAGWQRATDRSHQYIEFRGASGSFNVLIVTPASNSTLRMFVNGGSLENEQIAAVSEDGAWRQFGVSYSPGTFKVYSQGSHVADEATAWSDGDYDNLYLAAASTDTIGLDDFVVWDRQPNDAEFLAHYLAGRNGRL